MTILQSFKLQGQTTGDAAIATKTIEVHSDGTIRFLDANSKPHSIHPHGALGVLMTEVLTGTSGLTSKLLK